MQTFRLRIDGRSVSVHTEAEMPLMYVLRGNLGLSDRQPECGPAECGACTVQLDGEPVRACAMPISAAAGKSVTTALSRA